MNEIDSSLKNKINQLSKMELSILILMSNGISSKKIAALNGIPLYTIENYQRGIISKLNLTNNRNNLSKWAILNKNHF